MAIRVTDPPPAESLQRLSAGEVIDALAEQWLRLSKAERNAYTHVLIDHPDRVEIFNQLFARASRADAAMKKARH